MTMTSSCAAGEARAVDDERPVEALVDVLLQRRRVAVVEVHPVGACGELVREAAAGLTISKTPSMSAGWIPWKWIGVRVRAPVAKVDAEEVALGRAVSAPGRAVVRPGREEDALGDLDLVVLRHQRVLADAAGLVRQHRRRIGQRVEVVWARPERTASPDHGGVAHGGVICAEVGGLQLPAPGERHAGERRGRDDGRHAGDQLPAAEAARS